jgi:pilus assembly protein CpaE
MNYGGVEEKWVEDKPERQSGPHGPSEIPDISELKVSIVLVSPNESSRRSIRRASEAQRATIVREFTSYPTYGQIPDLIDIECDAFVVEVDSDPDIAMDLVEVISTRKPSATVMIYAASPDGSLVVRAMRVGAREVLTGLIPANDLRQALLRAASRRSELSTKKAIGQLMVFWGAKGGGGVTTLASNFAIALRMETSQPVALLDLNPDLGDVAVLLGVNPRFTVAEALQNGKRLDADFVSTLMTSHDSGISILAAPDTYSTSIQTDSRTVGKLVDVIRNQYPYVVVDAGRGLREGGEPLFQMANTLYLVTQLSIPALRNTQRFLTYVQRQDGKNVELVINRYDSKRTEFDDERVSKVLGIKPKWKVPNDYASVNRSSDIGDPFITGKSPAAAVLRTMARVAAGKPATSEKKKSWGLFG